MSKRRSNGEGSFYENDGYWIGQVTMPNGKRKTVSSKNKKEALRRMRDLKSTIASGRYVEDNNYTVSSWVEYWLDNIKAFSLKKTTAENYQMLFKTHIKPYFKDVRLQKLTFEKVNEFIKTKLRDEGLSTRTVRYLFFILRSALKRAVNEKLVSTNVCDLVELPKLIKKEVQALDKGEVIELLEVGKKRSIYPIVFTALATGARLGEILALKWENVDLTNKLIRIRKTMVNTVNGQEEQTPKTKASIRSIDIPDDMVEMLKDIKNGRTKGYVFLNKNNVPFKHRNVQGSFKKLVDKTSITKEPTFHTLRHTHATHLLLLGVHPKVVQERLGHSDIKVTLDTYSHVLPTIQKEAAERIAYLFTEDKKEENDNKEIAENVAENDGGQQE